MNLLERQTPHGTSATAGPETLEPPRPDALRDAAFSELVQRHATFLYRVAFGLLRNSQDAEDAVQEALLKLFRGEGWTQMQNERAFLARTVWRVGLDRLTRSGASEMKHAEDVSELNPPAAGPSPEDTAVEASDRALLRRLIDGLPDDLRQPLLLSAIEGMTSAEVALTLAIPDATVRTRLMRARTELKQRFAAMTTAGKETRR